MLHRCLKYTFFLFVVAISACAKHLSVAAESVAKENINESGGENLSNLEYDLLLAKINYENDNIEDAISMYEKINKREVNESIFDLMEIYEKGNDNKSLIEISKLLIGDNRTYSRVKSKYYQLLARVINCKSCNYDWQVADYLGFYLYDYDSAVQYLDRASKVANIFINGSVDVDEQILDEDVKLILKFYMSKINNDGKFTLIDFISEHNEFSYIHNLIIFQEAYLSDLYLDVAKKQAFFLIDKALANKSNHKLDFAIIEYFSKDRVLFNLAKQRLNERYKNSVSYYNILYHIEKDNKSENISKAYNAALSKDRVFHNSFESDIDFLSKNYIKENYEKLTDKEIVDIFLNIYEESNRENVLLFVIDNMVRGNNLRVDLLGALHPNYKYYVALRYYNFEDYHKAFKWISQFEDPYDVDSDDGLNNTILMLITLQEINKELALSEAKRLYEAYELVDLKVLYHHLLLVNGKGSEESFELFNDIKEFESLNFIIRSRYTYKIINSNLSNQYYKDGDYNKALELLLELNEESGVIYGLIGRIYHKMGRADLARYNIERSKSIFDGNFIKNIEKEIEKPTK